MKTLSRALRFFIIVPVLLGCAVFRPTPTAQPPADATVAVPAASPTAAAAPTEPAPTAAPSIPALTEEMLANFTYSAPHTPDGRLPLQNGQFVLNQENPPVRVFSALDAVAFGDLNGDGIDDALAVLATNTGGSGTFFDLIALLNQNGVPLQIASTSFGDRQLVKSLRIEDGSAILDYMTQGPQDGACCPSQHNLRTYILEGGLLSLTSEQVLESEAAQATPLPNRIIIDRPQPYEQILGRTVEVRGRIGQVPPGGTLAYYVTNLEGTRIQEGSVPVSGAPGQMGSFSFVLELDDSAQYIAWIEVVDAENGLLRGRTPVGILLPAQ